MYEPCTGWLPPWTMPLRAGTTVSVGATGVPMPQPVIEARPDSIRMANPETLHRCVTERFINIASPKLWVAVVGWDTAETVA